MGETATGVLTLSQKGGGVLRDPARSFQPRPSDVQVPRNLVRQHGLVEGAAVTGTVRKNGRRRELVDVVSVCGLKPEDFYHRQAFKELTALTPVERFHLEAAGELSMRVVDLVAPLGKGSRCLVVSPPKAGKTVLLEQIAAGIRADDPDARIVALLVDERPEEVTHFRRATQAEVLASSNDQDTQEHVRLTELAMAHIRAELECGRDIVVLIDSLTRMARAFNLGTRGRGRTMSGGVEAGALEIPRRFFGLARNAEEGGSVTIVGTVLVDTGSRMDQLIFEEFKGTGNSEIVLDRRLAESRIFPAIDIAASGTRREEELFGPDRMPRVAAIRKALSGLKPDRAVTTLLDRLGKTASNEAFLQDLPSVS